MKNKIRRNITLEYLFRFIGNFSITEVIWVLYLAHKGLSLTEIGILEGIFHVTSLLSEVPSGALADLMGRKRVMIVSCISSMISACIMLVSSQMWQFGIAFVFSAWSFNLMSGSEDALVYDSLLYLGEETSYYKVNSRLEVIIEVAQALATFVGGLLAECSFAYCYIATIVIGGISLLPCSLMKEPVLEHSTKKEKISWKEHFVTSFQVMKENPAVRKILFFYSYVFTFYTSVFFYCQKYFEEAGLNKVQISLVMLFAGTVSCFGSIWSEKLVRKVGENMKYIAAFVMGASILGMAFGNVIVSIGCIAGTSFFNAMLYPLQSASLNSLIPSEQRATIISVGSMIFSVFMIVLFPVMGFAADNFGLHVSFLIAGTCEVCSMLLISNKKK